MVDQDMRHFIVLERIGESRGAGCFQCFLCHGVFEVRVGPGEAAHELIQDIVNQEFALHIAGQGAVIDIAHDEHCILTGWILQDVTCVFPQAEDFG